ncbi:MAG: YraN family protein [Henriciella sp.]
MANRDRRGAERRGRRAETFAAVWLRLKGYQILASRFKCKVGEIDLIAKRGSVLALIEVKQRPTTDVAASSVPQRNWLRIAAAAEVWASRQTKIAQLDWRYDLVAITPRSFPKHYRDFWRP